MSTGPASPKPSFWSKLLFRRASAPVIVLLALTTAVTGWIWWGDWPAPASTPNIENPGLILTLGGGDGPRISETLRLAELFPNSPLLVTGDGGLIVKGLLDGGLNPERLQIEPAAKSTWENAVLSKPWIDEVANDPIILVTDDFHAQRSLAVFHSVFPSRRFTVSYEPTKPPYNQSQQSSRRRERAAALYYALRYRVWCF